MSILKNSNKATRPSSTIVQNIYGEGYRLNTYNKNDLKTKYRTLLFVAIGSVPVVLLGISVAMSILYDKAFKMKNDGIPFHESYAYPVMLIAFVLALGMLAWLFSTSIHSLLSKITLLNKTIRELASNERIPDTLTIKSEDEIGQLSQSVNLLIERTTYRELELAQRQELQKRRYKSCDMTFIRR